MMEKVKETYYQYMLDIMHPESDSDIFAIRNMIMEAEDLAFSVEQSKIVSPWLLNFAAENRNDSDNEDAIYSAIRTGASMLYPNEVELLFPLLESGYDVSTVRVTVKMIGRIFEAQPPSKVGEYEYISKKIYDIAMLILNDSSAELSSCGEAATVQLGILALISMGSTRSELVLSEVKNEASWFQEYVLHNMEELRVIWQNRTEPISSQMKVFLDEAINFLEK